MSKLGFESKFLHFEDELDLKGFSEEEIKQLWGIIFPKLSNHNGKIILCNTSIEGVKTTPINPHFLTEGIKD